MQLLKNKRNWIVCVILLGMLSCGKEYHNYEHFIKNGPIVYPGRPDTVQAFAGKERILLSWAIPSDLNITHYKVFWNFGTDSVTIPGRKPASGDSIKIYINDLSEGSYSFTVHSYDKEEHKSVGTQSIGNAYGPIFFSTIYNRPISSLKRDATASKLLVAWVGIDPKCVSTEWLYTDADGQPASFYSPIDDSTIITSCDVTKPVSYRSLFLPEPKAIDTFFTEFKNL